MILANQDIVYCWYTILSIIVLYFANQYGKRVVLCFVNARLSSTITFTSVIWKQVFLPWWRGWDSNLVFRQFGKHGKTIAQIANLTFACLTLRMNILPAMWSDRIRWFVLSLLHDSLYHFLITEVNPVFSYRLRPLLCPLTSTIMCPPKAINKKSFDFSKDFGGGA